MSSQRPTICQLVHTLNVGGAEILAGNLVRRLRDRYRFIFTCLDDPGFGAARLRDEGFTVEVIGRRPGLDWRCPLRLAACWRQHGVGLIQAHQYTPFFYSLMARFRSLQLPIIFTEHGRHFPDFPRPKRMFANRLLIRPRDRVVAVGRSVKQALVENEGIPGRRIQVIPNGIDIERFAPSSCTKDAVRAELGISPHCFLVMMVARLDPIKDHLTAIQACARASAAVPELRLVVVGDGPERPAIEAFIQAHRLQGLVELLGTRSDVARLLTAADALLLTSVSEGIPLTIIEAMATGLPVVSTDVGSVADVVLHGVTGLLAPARNNEVLAEHLVRLGQSSLVRAAMGDRGRSRALVEFSENTMAERYAELFDSLLTRRPRRPSVPSLTTISW